MRVNGCEKKTLNEFIQRKKRIISEQKYNEYKLSRKILSMPNNSHLAIAYTVLQAKPEDTLDLSRLLNDDLAKSVKQHPDRFVGLGTLPLQAPELAVQELIRCKHELGIVDTAQSDKEQHSPLISH